MKYRYAPTWQASLVPWVRGLFSSFSSYHIDLEQLRYVDRSCILSILGHTWWKFLIVFLSPSSLHHLFSATSDHLNFLSSWINQKLRRLLLTVICSVEGLLWLFEKVSELHGDISLFGTDQGSIDFTSVAAADQAKATLASCTSTSATSGVKSPHSIHLYRRHNFESLVL